MGKAKIFVVEDEADLQELLEYNLTKEGYGVVCLASGEDCLKRASVDHPDLILLDIMLPGADGFEVCRELKGNPSTQGIPIVMLTAKGEEADIVTGLELGAEDYITKPFSPRVLVARVRSVLRRNKASRTSSDDVLKIHELVIDPGRHEVLLDGTKTELTHTEFRVLHYLARNAGRVLTRTRIVDGVHGDDYPVTERSVDVQVVGLRKKLGNFGQYIETVRGVGYRFKE